MNRELTERELSVVRLVADGKTNDQIGKQLAISTSTVKAHLARIVLKLQTHNRAEVVHWAAKKHLLGQKNKEPSSL